MLMAFFTLIIMTVASLSAQATNIARAYNELLSPVFVNEGTYSESADVIIAAGDTDTENIYYTIDGTTPSAANGTLYTAPFTITTETTVKAVAVKEGWTDSPIAIGHYMILKPNGMSPDENPEGLVLAKSFTPDGTENNNSGMLTLESYVTGNSITVSSAVPPTDIVLVLDYSSSMVGNDIPYITSSGVQSTQKRIDALKASVSSFLQQIADASNQPSGEFEGMHHRVAFVTYGTKGRMWYGNPSSMSQLNKGDTTAFTTASVFDQAFYEVNGSGYNHSLAWSVLGNKYGSTQDSETELQYAMPLVQGIFDYNPADIPGGGSRNRMVVVFTDGGIGSGHWLGGNDPNNISYAEGKANYTLRKANLMKNSYGAAFYSVGIFPENPVGHVGGSSPYYSEDLPDYHPYESSHSSDYYEYTPYWADNVSRFMALRSSNYPGSMSMTDTGAGSNASGYFMIATDATQLTSAFTTISQTIATPSMSLGSQTVVEDVISDAFMLPEGSGVNDIKVYTANCTGVNPYTFDTPVLFEDAEVQIDGKRIFVTNFDFAANWCGENSSTHVAHGKKLIVEIPIVRDFSGSASAGTYQTNGDDSGVYSDDGAQVGAFLSPEVYLDASEGIMEIVEENFAFFVGNQLVVNGTGDLQLVDINGRVLFTHYVVGQQSHITLPTVAEGVYLLQLSGTDGVKVQKIVIRK